MVFRIFFALTSNMKRTAVRYCFIKQSFRHWGDHVIINCTTSCTLTWESNVVWVSTKILDMFSNPPEKIKRLWFNFPFTLIWKGCYKIWNSLIGVSFCKKKSRFYSDNKTNKKHQKKFKAFLFNIKICVMLMISDSYWQNHHKRNHLSFFKTSLFYSN